MRELFFEQGVQGYPYHWQLPAATEKAAFDSMVKTQCGEGFQYVGFPWATLIDGMRGNSEIVGELLMSLRIMRDRLGGAKKRITVAQHIHATQFLDLYKALGITDLFWSHARSSQPNLQGLRIHAFPLYPAQAIGQTRMWSNASRRFLANFVGAFSASIYLTNVREIIFNDAGKFDDVLIVKREGWHFDRAVYHEQIGGNQPTAELLRKEGNEKAEYLQAIRDSWFTLCPSGSGPNSIRIFESLALGSIPIILAKDLMMPGDADCWKAAAIIEDDTGEGYRRAITLARKMTVDAKMKMLAAGQELYSQVAPEAYAGLIEQALHVNRTRGA